MNSRFNLETLLDLDEILKKSLSEDMGQGDLTTDTFIPKDCVIEAEWFAKESCCVAGIDIIRRLYEILDPGVKLFWNVEEGHKIDRGAFGLIKGCAHSILKGERTALNFLQRLSGIATLTSAFVEKAKIYGVQILDTRKTTPLLRALEKYAVRVGGGVNHRMGLDSMVLLKDNHRLILDDLKNDDWMKKIRLSKEKNPSIQIGVEVTRASEIPGAVHAGADFILLDNMTCEEVGLIVQEWQGRVLLEVSGGVNLRNVESYARTGVDRISVGGLTHSVRSIDISLEVLGVKGPVGPKSRFSEI